MISLTTIDSLKIDLFQNQYKQLIAYMQDDEHRAIKFLGAVAYCFQSNPELAKCEKTSLALSFMKMAEYDLFPSTVSGEAYVLPYRKGGESLAQFQLGYKGIVKLLARSGVVVINSAIIRENDIYSIEEGSEPRISHQIPMLKPRGEAIGVYVVVKYKGETIFKVMRADEVLAFKEFSKTKSSEYSPWITKSDPEGWMWRKTCLKQLSKLLPLNEELAKTIAIDNEEGDIKEFQKANMAETLKAKLQRPDADISDLPEVSSTEDKSDSV